MGRPPLVIAGATAAREPSSLILLVCFEAWSAPVWGKVGPKKKPPPPAVIPAFECGLLP